MGIILLKFYLGTHFLYHPVVVTEGSPYQFIVGTDVMRPHRIEIAMSDVDDITVGLDNCYICQETCGLPKELLEGAEERSNRLFATPSGTDDGGNQFADRPQAKLNTQAVLAPGCATLVDCKVPRPWVHATHFFAESATSLIEEYFVGVLPVVFTLCRENSLKLTVVKPTA